MAQLLDSLGHRHPRRAPLRAAAASPAGCGGDQPRLVRHVQRPRGHRRPDRRHRLRQERVRRMNGSMDDLYREVILDHHRRPRGHEPLAQPADARAEGKNPSCGDELTLELACRDGAIIGAHVECRGCAIATASGSILAELVPGRTPAQARELAEAFRAGDALARRRAARRPRARRPGSPDGRAQVPGAGQVRRCCPGSPCSRLSMPATAAAAAAPATTEV